MVPPGTILYVKVEYMPVNNERVGEFFIPNVALYQRSTKALKWFKSDRDPIGFTGWNRGPDTITANQRKMNGWQIPQNLRLELEEATYNAVDDALIAQWATRLGNSDNWSSY